MLSAEIVIAPEKLVAAVVIVSGAVFGPSMRLTCVRDICPPKVDHTEPGSSDASWQVVVCSTREHAASHFVELSMLTGDGGVRR